MITGILIGFAIGWVVFERPARVTSLINTAKAKLKGGN